MEVSVGDRKKVQERIGERKKKKKVTERNVRGGR